MFAMTHFTRNPFLKYILSLSIRSQNNQFEILGSIRTDYTENVESSERAVGELQLGTKIGETR